MSMYRARRHLFCLVLLLALPLAWPAQAATRELKIATLLLAPEADTGKPADGEANAVVELNDALARELCRRLAARCSQHPLPFADIIPGVEAGNFQIGVGNVLRTPERESHVLFSHPLWRSSSRLVGKPAGIARHRPSDGSELRLQTLHAVRVAVVRGTQQQRYLNRLAPAQKLTLVETATVGESLRTLLDDRADFALMPIRSAYFLLAAQSPGTLSFAGPALTAEGLGGTVHLILPKSEKTLCREVDAALDAMRSDGTFHRIIRRYMPFLAD